MLNNMDIARLAAALRGDTVRKPKSRDAALAQVKAALPAEGVDFAAVEALIAAEEARLEDVLGAVRAMIPAKPKVRKQKELEIKIEAATAKPAKVRRSSKIGRVIAAMIGENGADEGFILSVFDKDPAKDRAYVNYVLHWIAHYSGYNVTSKKGKFVINETVTWIGEAKAE